MTNPERTVAAKTIHVALAVYDPKGTYSQHAGVVMTSIFENTQSPVCVHILHDESLSGENREKFLSLAERYAQNVVFHDMSEYVKKLGPDILRLVDKHFSQGTLYRLFAPQALTMEKVLYLDSDIVVNLDIKDLWEIPLEGCCLMGVPDDRFSEAAQKRLSLNGIRCRLNGCDPLSYINAGVLVMDLDRIRKAHDLLKECGHWFTRHRHTAYLNDQDFLNAFFRGRIKLANARFNRCNPYYGDPSNSILHATRAKPWAEYKGTSIEPLYWKTLLKTPWAATPESCIDALYSCLASAPLFHRHTSACYKKIFKRLIFDLFGFPASLFQILVILLREECIRLRQKAGRGADAPQKREEE